jgi:non-reducing end alpha-L-arabinofuranosidase
MNSIERSNCKRTLRIVMFAVLAYGALSVFGGLPARAFVLSVGPTTGFFGGYVCADVRGGSLAPGTPVQAYDCNAEPNQQFEFNGNTIYTMGGQRCLEAEVTADGIPGPFPVVSNVCNGSNNQFWLDQGLILNSSNYIGLYCLDATNMGNGTQLVVDLCNSNTTSQQWQLK